MYRLQVKTYFDAAHYITDYPGKCSRTHGHRFGVEAMLEGKDLDDMNILVDFGVVKDQLKEIIDSKLDHYLLNESLAEDNLTAEFLARYIFTYLRGYWKTPSKVKLVSVSVWESPDCGVKYYGEEGS